MITIRRLLLSLIFAFFVVAPVFANQHNGFLSQNTSAVVVAGGLIDPSTITGYEFDIHSDDLDGGALNDGDTITSWADKTGTYVLSNGDGTPQYKTSIINGNSVARLDGANPDRLRDGSPAISWSTKYSFAYVVDDNSTGSKFIVNNSAGNALEIYIRDSGNVFDADFGNVNILATSFPSGKGRGNWWIIIGTVDLTVAEAKIYLNSDTATFSNTNTSTTAPAATYLNFPSNSAHASCDIARFILWDGYILTAQEISDLNDLFNDEYGITISND